MTSIENPSMLRSSFIQLKEPGVLGRYLREPEKYATEISDLENKNASILESHLNSDLLKKLYSLNNPNTTVDTNPPALILIKNFPFTGVKDLEQAEQLLLGISKLVNMNTFSYRDEHDGRLIDHIKPIRKHINSLTSLGSLRDLPMHVDSAFDTNRPNYMALYCITSHSSAVTKFLSINKFFELVPPTLRNEMLSIGFSNQFLFSSPDSHTKVQHAQGSLFYNISNSQFGSRYSSSRNTGVTEEANKLLKNVKGFLESKYRSMIDGYILEPGDLVIWSNEALLHGRSAFNSENDDDRFLARVYLAKNNLLPRVRK